MQQKKNAMDAANPLLQDWDAPNHAPPFDRIAEAHFLPAIEQAIAAARENIATIKADKGAPGFENTIVALETASETLGVVSSAFYNQLSAAGTDGLHALAEKIGPLSASFSSDVLLDEMLFARVKAVHDKKQALKLTAEQETLLDETYSGFVRNGALLDKAGKEHLRELDRKMSVLGPAFMNNVTKSAEKFEFYISDKKKLAGLPEAALAGAQCAAEEKGRPGEWLFTLDYPSYGPFMQFADDRALREKMWCAFGSRAFGDEFDNCATVLDIVRLRDERAKLLGYENHAAFVLERRMAEAPGEVLSFVEKLKKAYKPAAQKDLKQLKDFAATIGGPDNLMPWDVGYYAEKLKQNLYHFSSEDLRPYFPLQTVLQGCFAHFSKLFGLAFRENKKYPVWHPDVTAYDVTDMKDGGFIGTLYADFFPRTGKKDGAWKTSYRDQGLFRGKVERPVVAIVCNFTKPTKDAPSLLTHDEVSTLFHEMGHAVHALLSRVTYQSLAGTNVKWDFVELPSQLQENWTYQKETLDMISGHYKTGEKIPAALVEKLNDAKNFMAGWAGLRQVNFCALDMAWHTKDPMEITDVAAFEDAQTRDTTLFPRMAGPASVAFSHLFAGGYSAGYYSYKWAEVLDADAFELFTEKGLYDRATAESYKNEVLSRGGSEHPRVLYRRFRGRDADPGALLRREGLAGNTA